MIWVYATNSHPDLVEPVDTVYVDFGNQNSLERDCMDAVRNGSTCKTVIHPAQIDVMNRKLTPSAQQIAEACSTINALAEAGGAGEVGMGGMMYYIPCLNRSRKLLKRAVACGIS